MMVRQFRSELAAVCVCVCIAGVSCSDATDNGSSTTEIGGANTNNSDPAANGGSSDSSDAGGMSTGGTRSDRTGAGGATRERGGAGVAEGGSSHTATGGVERGGSNVGGAVGLGNGGSQSQTSAETSVRGGANARGGTSSRSSTSASTGGSLSSTGSSAKTGGATGTGDSSSVAKAPTWTELYNKYMATGTVGHCASCHSQSNSASKAYSFLKSDGQINGTASKLVVQGSSRLLWFGGKMPEDGKASDATPELLADFRAWVAAGALNN
ncbi:MAG TPA: hypothetical protein VKP30_14440 [Polyangiaceae bacterium]|nr:hypothetical protein [Polyangiaceae bacterium]